MLKIVPDDIFVFFVFSFRVFPSPEHDGGVDVGWTEGVRLVQQAHDGQQDGPKTF
jgi:hypothetical protein